MWRVYIQQRYPTAHRWYQRIERQPSWVTKVALGVAVLVIVVPLALLTLAALAVGVMTLVILGLLARAAATLRFLTGGLRQGPRHGNGPPVAWDAGRRNVRVIDHS